MRIAFHLNFAVEVNGQKVLSKRSWNRLCSRVQARDNFTCFYCGTFDEQGQVDHIIPLSRGGTDNLENLVWACQSCNSSKGDMTLQEWRSKQETDRLIEKRKQLEADLGAERQKEEEARALLFSHKNVRQIWESIPENKRTKTSLCVALDGKPEGGHFYKVDAIGRELGLWE